MLNNLQEWLTELRESLFTRLLVYYERIQLRNRQTKRCTEQDVAEEVLSSHVPSRHSHVFIHPEVLQPQYFRDFYGGFIM